MATRSAIIYQQPDGTYLGAYIHWGGRPDSNGATLKEHYTKPERIEKLLDHGNMSVLSKHIDPLPYEVPEAGYYGIDNRTTKTHSFHKAQLGVCVFYRRDRRDYEHQTKSQHFEALEPAANHFAALDCDYLYLFQESRWKVARASFNAKRKVASVSEFQDF